MSKAFFSEAGAAVFGAFSDDCPCGCVSDGTFYTTWQTATTNETITLPLVVGYNYNAVIDWGDGTPDSTITAWDDVDKTHLYATAGSHTVTISGLFEAWQFANSGDKSKIIAVNFNDKKFKYLMNGFWGCSNLATISGKIGSCSITSLYRCFYYCSSLQSIPSGLFDNCTEVTSFSMCFTRCESLQSIPSGLFDNCTEVTSFAYVFNTCSSLQSIPSGLFDNCTEVTNFNAAFGGCWVLSGPSGSLWLNPSNAANYTLTSPDYDSGKPVGQYCYYGCTGLSDYATIPNYWK